MNAKQRYLLYSRHCCYSGHFVDIGGDASAYGLFVLDDKYSKVHKIDVLFVWCEEYSICVTVLFVFCLF